MAQLCRLQVGLSGTPVVGPGLMTFYGLTSGSGMVAAVTAFVQSFVGGVPSGVTFSIPGGGDLIEDTTGQISGAWSDGTASTIVSNNTTGYVLGQGARIEWHTGTVVAGRHLRGRTFLVPLANGCFDNNGRVAANVASGFVTDGQNLITAMGGNLVIWSRPKPARTGKKGPLPAQIGTHGAVTLASAPTTPTALRTRRT